MRNLRDLVKMQSLVQHVWVGPETAFLTTAMLQSKLLVPGLSKCPLFTHSASESEPRPGCPRHSPSGGGVLLPECVQITITVPLAPMHTPEFLTQPCWRVCISTSPPGGTNDADILRTGALN